jgi:hypothetical protein
LKFDPACCIDRVPWVIYGRIKEPPGCITQPAYDIFKEPLNYERGLGDTNIYLRNALPLPQVFYMYSFHPLWGMMRWHDRMAFQQNYTLEIIAGCKVFRQLPLQLLKGEQLLKALKEGQLLARLGCEAEYPLVIPSGVNVEFRLVGNPVRLNPLGKGLNLLIAGNGLLDRAVQ